MNKLEIFLIRKVHFIRRLDIFLAILSFLTVALISVDYSFAEISEDCPYRLQILLIPIAYLWSEIILINIFIKLKKYKERQDQFTINRTKKIIVSINSGNPNQTIVKNLINLLGLEYRYVTIKDLFIAKILGIIISIIAISILLFFYKTNTAILLFVIIGLIFLIKYYQEGGMNKEEE